MQATFSFRRLGLLIRKQWAERSRLYTLMMSAITGLLIIAFILWWTASDNDTIYLEPFFFFFFVGLFLGGCIMAGTTFSDLSQRTTGMYYLGVPATHGEKLLCGILFSQVFFNAAYLAIFFLIREGALGLIEMNPHIRVGRLPNFIELRQAGFYLSVTYLAVQTFYLFGSVYFERFAFVKTTVAGAVSIVAFFLFIVYAVGPILGGHSFGVAGVGEVRVDGINGIFTFPQWLSRLLYFLLRYIWAPVFWVAAYFRLKEKEI